MIQLRHFGMEIRSAQHCLGVRPEYIFADDSDRTQDNSQMILIVISSSTRIHLNNIETVETTIYPCISKSIVMESNEVHLLTNQLKPKTKVIATVYIVFKRSANYDYYYSCAFVVRLSKFEYLYSFFEDS